jgi:hypothetical protein
MSPAEPALNGRGSPAAPNRAARRRAWPKRRDWLYSIGTDRRLTSGCKSWLLLLARRSDDAGKPVWGRQTKQADDLGRGDRSVRRYRVEAEQLGYVKCYRARPQRGPDGRWSRRATNRYYLCLPSRMMAVQPAPRRRQRSPYCVVRATSARSSHLADSNGRLNPDGVCQPAPHPPVPNIKPAASHEKPTPPPSRSPEVAAAIAAARAKLGPALATPRSPSNP